VTHRSSGSACHRTELVGRSGRLDRAGSLDGLGLWAPSATSRSWPSRSESQPGSRLSRRPTSAALCANDGYEGDHLARVSAEIVHERHRAVGVDLTLGAGLSTQLEPALEEHP
jgi:hypothetical protein